MRNLLLFLLHVLWNVQTADAFFITPHHHLPSPQRSSSLLHLEPPAPATSESSNNSNNNNNNPFEITSTPLEDGTDRIETTLTFHSIPGQSATTPPTTISTGTLGRLTAGAVTLTRGDTVLYVTAARDADPKSELDFCPLSMEHQERFSATGSTSGAFHKRDGRPAEHEILTCRLMDRPIRPLIHKGWRHETQVLSWVLSYDTVRDVAPAAVVAASAALAISDIPLRTPVAAVQVGMVNTTTTGVTNDTATTMEFVVNPTLEEMEASPLLLTVAGTEEAVLMIEGEADFLPEAMFIEAIRCGHEAVQCICQGLQALADTVGKEKKMDTIQYPPEGLQERVNELMTDRVDEMFAAPGNKKEKGRLMTNVQAAAIEELSAEFEGVTEAAILGAFKNLLTARMFVRAKEQGLRGDGRRLDEIRNLSMETSILPRVHGSALFTRGETQAIATATLGDSGMRQKVDKIGGMESKRFYLQYTFPPSCVGETGRVGMPGRREVGHGNLAERALVPTLPSEEDFPYSIRVESLITESHGSSSMASVCGGCLALMNAGVPIQKPVAGIAMGMLLDDKSNVSVEDAIVLTDITGTEDALGMMDFKVAGDREGVTTFQLDIKCEGLTLEIMEKALEQARLGRLHILDAMEAAVGVSSTELPSTVPRMQSCTVPVDSLGKVIGPGGRQIRSIIEDFKLINMDVGEDGVIQFSSLETEQLPKAIEFVQALVAPGAGRGGDGGGRSMLPPYNGTALVEGETYTGKIKGIHNFGVFVEIIPPPEDGSTQGVEGLCHVSQLAHDHVRNCEGFVRAMNVEELTVQYQGKDHRGKVKLSRKAILPDKPVRKVYPKKTSPTNGASDSVTKKSTKPKAPSSDMPQAELDVIAKAIDEVI